MEETQPTRLILRYQNLPAERVLRELADRLAVTWRIKHVWNHRVVWEECPTYEWERILEYHGNIGRKLKNEQHNSRRRHVMELLMI